MVAFPSWWWPRISAARSRRQWITTRCWPPSVTSWESTGSVRPRKRRRCTTSCKPPPARVRSADSGGASLRFVPALADAFEQRAHRGFPQVRTTLLIENANGACLVERLSIGAIGNQDVVRVGHRQDARLQRDLLAAKTAWIAAAIEAFMVGDY